MKNLCCLAEGLKFSLGSVFYGYVYGYGYSCGCDPTFQIFQPAIFGLLFRVRCDKMQTIFFRVLL